MPSFVRCMCVWESQAPIPHLEDRQKDIWYFKPCLCSSLARASLFLGSRPLCLQPGNGSAALTGYPRKTADQNIWPWRSGETWGSLNSQHSGERNHPLREKVKGWESRLSKEAWGQRGVPSSQHQEGVDKEARTTEPSCVLRETTCLLTMVALGPPGPQRFSSPWCSESLGCHHSHSLAATATTTAFPQAGLLLGLCGS